MPAEVLQLHLRLVHGPLENRARQSGESQRSLDPTRGRMAGQERRIDDTILIREAQSGNRRLRGTGASLRSGGVAPGAASDGTEHDAQDVYQDAFLKAYKNIGSFVSSVRSIPGFIAS